MIAEAKGVSSPDGKSVQELYHRLLAQLGNELFILQDASLKQIEATGDATQRVQLTFPPSARNGGKSPAANGSGKP